MDAATTINDTDAAEIRQVILLVIGLVATVYWLFRQWQKGHLTLPFLGKHRVEGSIEDDEEIEWDLSEDEIANLERAYDEGAVLRQSLASGDYLVVFDDNSRAELSETEAAYFQELEERRPRPKRVQRNSSTKAPSRPAPAVNRNGHYDSTPAPAYVPVGVGIGAGAADSGTLPPSTKGPVVGNSNNLPAVPNPTRTRAQQAAWEQKQRTLQDIAKLPKEVEMPLTPLGRIPLMYNSQGQWIYFDLFGNGGEWGGHWGVFGASGGGKSNLLQLMALTALSFDPTNVELVVVDGKDGVDYSFCDVLKHSRLYFGDKIGEGLNYVNEWREERNKLLRQVHARKVDEYEKITGRRLNNLVVICDEMGMYPERERKLVEKIVQSGRSSGLLTLVSTQYPKAEVISSIIQANLKNRIVFWLPGREYTPIALDREVVEEGSYEPSAINQAGVAILRNNGGIEQIGRVPFVSYEMRQQKIEMLFKLYPRQSQDQLQPNFPAPENAPEIFPKSGKSPENPLWGGKNAENQFKPIFQGGNFPVHGATPGKFPGPENSPENFFQPQNSPIQLDFSAFSVSGEGGEVELKPTEMARIIAQILAGKNKTEILRGMPGYSGRKHKEYNRLYLQLEAGAKGVEFINEDEAESNPGFESQAS